MWRCCCHQAHAFVYTRTASILIKDETSGKSVSSNVADLEEFGLFHTNTNVNNEIIALQSPALMQNVVKRLHLDINYTVEGRLHEVVLYGNALPVNVSFPGLGDDAGAGLTVRLLADRRVELSAFSAGGEELPGQAACTAALGDTVATPVGQVVVQPTRYYRGNTLPYRGNQVEPLRRNAWLCGCAYGGFAR